MEELIKSNEKILLQEIRKTSILNLRDFFARMSSLSSLRSFSTNPHFSGVVNAGLLPALRSPELGEFVHIPPPLS